MRLLTPLSALWLVGCLQVIGGGDGAECELNDHCPSRERCDVERGRCVSSEGSFDAEPPVDAEVVDFARPDVAVDAGDAALPDVGPDLGPDMAPPPEGPFGLEADCFDGAPAATLDAMGRGSTHVPRGLCSSHVLAWTSEREGAVTLRYRTSPEGDPEVVGSVFPDTRIAVDGRVLLFASSNPGHPEVPNIRRLDLVTGDEAYLQVRNAAQTQPARTVGLSAFVEQADTTRHVRLDYDDVAEGDYDCIRAGRHQWGVVLWPEGLAFFERQEGTQRTDLVVVRGHRCDDQSRVVLPLPGRIAADARLTLGGTRLFWIAVDGTRLRDVWTVDVEALVDGPQRATFPGETVNPLDVDAHGPWVAVVSYQPGGYRLDVFDLEANRQKLLPNSSGSALQPSLSPSYLMWAEQSAAAPWEVRYARLEDL